MLTAFYRDIEVAGTQGTITGVTVKGVSFGVSEAQMWQSRIDKAFAWAFLIIAAAVFGWAAYHYNSSRRVVKNHLRQPLVPSSGVAA